MYKKRSIAVNVLKLPNGNYQLIDTFGRKEEVTPVEFHRYVVPDHTSPEVKNVDMKDELQQIYSFIQSGDIESASAKLELLL
jgi:hypothetical protein